MNAADEFSRRLTRQLKMSTSPEQARACLISQFDLPHRVPAS